MFRRSDGTKGFSWMRLLDNALPVMRTHDGLVDPGHLGLQQQDIIYTGQVVGLSINYRLRDCVFYMGGILASESESRKVYQRIQRTEVIGPNGAVDTTKIDGNFTHQLAIVPVLRQKQIVDLLFWWEEEAQRLKKLSEEKAELEDLVRGTADRDQRQVYAQLLKRVDGKISARPSQRIAAVEMDQDETILRFRSGNMSTPQEQEDDERPPAYSPRS